MKVANIKIGEYKILKNLDIDFTDQESGAPKKIIVLAGINGSGKTSLLEYIKKKVENLSFDKTGSIGILTEFEKRGYSNNSFLVSDIQSLNLNNDLNVNILKSKIPNYQLKIKDLKGVDNFIDESKKNIFIENLEKISSKISYFKTDNYKYKSVTNAIFSFVKKAIFENNEKPQDVYKIVQSTLDEIFESFKLKIKFGSIDTSTKGEKESFDVFFRNTITDKIPIESLSTGEKEIIMKAFYLKMFCPKNSVILIDEPEKSLHPKWQQLILDVYKDIAESSNSQFIIATHSPHIIASVKPENLFLLNVNKRITKKGRANGVIKGKVTGIVTGEINGEITNKMNLGINGKMNGKMNGKINGKINGYGFDVFKCNCVFEGEITGNVEGIIEGIIDGSFEGETTETSNVLIRNMADFQKHTLGVEPNRILMEIMGVAYLRPNKIQLKINKLTDLLVSDMYEKDETRELISELEKYLGVKDPFLIRVRHQIKILELKNRK